MDTAQTPARLEIEVADFGPIVHAKVDLRPMTVFIGPSNTGKSYLAILLYALHRFFGAGGGLHGFAPLAYRDYRSNPNRTLELTDETVADFRHLAQTIIETNAGSASGHITLPSRIKELLRSEFDDLGNALGAEIARCFGVNDAAMLARKGRRTRAGVAIRHSYSGDDLEHTVTFNADGVAFQSAIPQSVPTGTISRNRMAHFLSNPDWTHSRSGNIFEIPEFFYLISSLVSLAVPGMVGSLRLPAFYFPADRAGVMNTLRVIVSNLLAGASVAGLPTDMRTPMLSSTLADFLRGLIEIKETPTEQTAGIDDPGSAIEKAILGGTVRVERSELINYPHFIYRPDGWQDDLPLMNASSMVSELAPLVLYLRHIAQPGNVLIIEEPESHLHPAMQVEFTRQLAKLAQAGYRVIITTHSEWILEELANVVLRSQLPPDQRAETPGGDATLTPDQVGVWLFQNKRRPKGSVVTPVPIGENDLYDSRFDDVAIALHNDWANIADRARNNE